MKLIIDAQLPPALRHVLSAAGHDVYHVIDLGLRDATDAELWGRAERDGAVILTKDEDFAARRRRSERGPSIIWVRIGNCTNAALIERLLPLLPEITEHLDRGEPLIEIR